jgi:membrane protease YdiL (CAAX protease family)
MKVVTIAILALIASIAPDIILQQTIGFAPQWMGFAKLIFLTIICFVTLLTPKLREISNFTLILASISIVNLFTNFIQSTDYWRSSFDTASFVGNFGGSILLKAIGVIPIIILLFILYHSRNEFYLCIGDLNKKAEKINWLGIAPNSISWRKLAIISALLISFGTILLTIITATQFTTVNGIGLLFKYLPLILLLALGNSFCEGILFRNAILSTLKTALPKNQLLLLAGVFFGIGHYYGIPSGITGVAMSSLLGWYMCRSMYETNGFVSSWIIHFMQDTVIFSTILLLGKWF